MPVTLTRAFWLGLLDRAIKTAAHTMLALLLAGPGLSSLGANVLAVNWQGVLSATAGAVALSVLTSLGSCQVGDPGTTSAIGGAR